MPLTTLENETLRVTLDPDQGTSIKAFCARVGEDWLPLMPDVRAESSRLPAASFLMVPYSNRIENGTFTFQGRRYQLAHGERHAIHGDVRTRPWKVVSETATRLTCTLRSADHESVNWPWPFEAEAEYTMSDNTFSSRLALWNRGETAMPAGFGWHPYFNRSLTPEGEPVHLCFTVAGVYPDANDNRIPSGPAQPLTPEQDFSAEKPLDPDRFFDHCFQGYDGRGYIAWPESGVKLSFDCSPACQHLIVYNPPFPVFAVEPVTNANNGVNLYAAGWPDSGVVTLAPGECLRAHFDLCLDVETSCRPSIDQPKSRPMRASSSFSTR
jgi:aldose 1-epimerase